MKQLLRRAARWLASKPGIGRLVRIGIVVARLPAHVDRQQVFLTQQLPQLLDTLSDINHRQANLDRDQESLTKTAPIVLRQLTRDVWALRQEIETLKRVDAQPEGNPITRSSHGTGDQHIEVESGSGPRKGRIVLDFPLPHATTVAQLDNLPLGNAQVNDIYASHVLEFFSSEQLSRSLLPRLNALLAPGGRLHVTALDLEAMVRRRSAGDLSRGDLGEALLGVRAMEGDRPRQQPLTVLTLTQLLQDASFTTIRLVGEARPIGGELEFEVVAQKGKALQ